MRTKKTLLTFNKYLRNEATRDVMIVRHAGASARIEGVKKAHSRARRIFRKSRSSR